MNLDQIFGVVIALDEIYKPRTNGSIREPRTISHS